MSLGSSAVVGFTRVRAGVTGFSGVVGFNRVRTGVVWVHPGPLCSLSFALRVVG